MTTTETIEFDADRLLVLDQKRRTARALQRDASDHYQDLRERREDAKQRAGNLRWKSEHGDASGRHAALEQAEEIEKEIEKLTRQMAEMQTEQNTHSTTAGKANSLFRKCLSFAVENGLQIPDQLAEEARKIAQRVAE
ncbi:hypothetical protein [Celeribacter naphthalenivorans]|uniref:hypothetical protein n=1 Tax=Celeribacter naphthalenivorans TaxID=1614694 RepID=UPI001CF94C9B|nr:hypothetical protein [Celeribacter naphthalenivorans]